MATVLDSYTESHKDTNGTMYNGSFTGIGQTVTPSASATLYSTKFYVSKAGTPSGNIVSKIYSTSGTYGTNAIPSGTALATSDVVVANSLSTSFSLVEFTFSGTNAISLTGGTHYAVTIEYSGGDISNNVLVGVGGDGSGHGGDEVVKSGSSWTGTSSQDTVFYMLGVGPPVADFSADSTTVTLRDAEVSFTDSTTFEPTSWAWDFGDGATSTQQNPTHTYTALGTYTVSLIATNVYGTDTETKTNYMVVRSLVPDDSKLAFYSGHPVDKIVAIYPGTFTATASSLASSPFRTEKTIPHSFGQTLFLDMTWSEDGGTTWQSMNNGVPDLSNPAAPVFQTRMVGCYSTTTAVVVTCSNYTTTAKTITYNIAASWKD